MQTTKRQSDQRGFTLLEVVVSMGIFMIIMMVTSFAFQNILKKSATLRKGAESNIEGIVGLEMLRSDLTQAGFGLPWSFSTTPTYSEVQSYQVGWSAGAGIDPKTLNDLPSTTPPSLPRAVISAINPPLSTKTIPGSDYLVIKSMKVAFDAAAKKWNYVKYSSATGGGNKSYLKTWGVPGALISSADWKDGDRVISISTTYDPDTLILDKQLAVDSTSPGSFYYPVPTYTSAPGSWAPPSDAFKPADNSKMMILYGVADPAIGVPLKAPYNRADYYIDKSSPTAATCAPGTGTLVKAVLDHASGGFNATHTYPILDCVGDMQVVYNLDMNDDGAPGTYANADGSVISGNEGSNISSVQATLGNAASLRSRLKQVLVYVLTHEGQRDSNFKYPFSDANRVISVVDPSLGLIPGGSRGGVWKQSDLAATFGPNWNNYRWKIYTIAVKPGNLN